MYDPQKVLTESGYEDYRHHLKNLEDALFFLTNHADDLHIGAKDSRQLDILCDLQEMLPVYKCGDGE